MNNYKEEEIKYRLSRSTESLQDAQALIAIESWNGAANRLYYAAYYVVVALMVKHEIKITSRDGAKPMLGLQFVKTGRLDVRFSKIYGHLFNTRQSGDYGNFIYHSSEKILPLLDETEQFIAAVRQLVAE
ncbi:HEPN domain-containing protein [Larkinella sp.]|uniref:HEPN domain-containing protein n=1 Tax=Larkinella sp. TaxID=2034517 RepID=UPI003BACDC65